jgi:2-dehydropantoate 2-reductase
MERPILIAGAGALGSVFAAMLRGASHEIALLGRRPHLDAIARSGLRVSGLFGERTARGFTLAANPSELKEQFELIFCTVKSYDTESIAPALARLLANDGVIVSAQNGLGNIETLAAHLGAHRVLGARVIFGAEIVEPGAARVTVFAEPVAIGPAPAINGEASARLKSRASEIAAMMSAAGIPTEARDDIIPVLWTKVLYNVALNPLGALLGLHYGALGDDPDLRAIMDAAIDEAFAVARAHGVALPFADAGEYRARFYGKLLPPTYDHRPSMLADLERRGRTEIDALNGKIVELADRLAIDAPVNRTLMRLIHARERIRAAALGDKR